METGFVDRVHQEHPEILTSFHTLAGLSSQYSWLAKSKICELLNVSNPENLSEFIWHPIFRVEFSELTKIERIATKLASRAGELFSGQTMAKSSHQYDLLFKFHITIF